MPWSSVSFNLWFLRLTIKITRITTTLRTSRARTASNAPATPPPMAPILVPKTPPAVPKSLDLPLSLSPFVDVDPSTGSRVVTCSKAHIIICYINSTLSE